jgi:hypothetical protein
MEFSSSKIIDIFYSRGQYLLKLFESFLVERVLLKGGA